MFIHAAGRVALAEVCVVEASTEWSDRSITELYTFRTEEVGHGNPRLFFSEFLYYRHEGWNRLRVHMRLGPVG
jgi:hypothetical protein